MVEDVFDASFALNLENILGKSRWHLTEIRNAYKLHTYEVEWQVADPECSGRPASFDDQTTNGHNYCS